MKKNRRRFLKRSALSIAGTTMINPYVSQALNMPSKNTLQLLRHATLILNFDDKKLLVDPMLSAMGELRAISNARIVKKNPLVDLPMPASEVLENIDAMLLTHLHFDHFDDQAKEMIPAETATFCQGGDGSKIMEAGFKQVNEIEASFLWQGIEIVRTGGQHGTGEIAERMGKVSGFVLKKEGCPTVYVAGDTIWCPEVEESLNTYNPDVIVLNAGAATFLEGDPITMTTSDISKVYHAAPKAQIFPVHMESINHCELKRAELAGFLKSNDMTDRVAILNDGETVSI